MSAKADVAASEARVTDRAAVSEARTMDRIAQARTAAVGGFAVGAITLIDRLL